MIQPENWSKHNDICTLVSQRCMNKYKSLFDWKDNASILEFGMADGRNTVEALWPYIPTNFKEFIGSDISEVMVEYASKQLEHERVKFIRLDISCKEIPQGYENRFDNIFSFFVMHWVQNTRQAFLNMYNMLKPGGILFAIFVERTSCDEVYDFLSKHPKWKRYGHEKLISPFHFHENPQEEYEKIIREVGFSIHSFEVGNWRYAFPSEKAFEELFYSTNPIIGDIPKEDVEEYNKLYMGKMKRNNLNWVTKCEETGKEVFHSSYKYFILFAKKPNV
ncbi:hypothetical protein JTB14_029198 [Gonioctena quinquepunctata]|nr:hypothetical protein JTB14_029198 [Gonioctena quinquepunctata]